MSPEFATDRSDFLGCSEVWYQAAENDVRSHVGNWGMTGLASAPRASLRASSFQPQL